MPTTSAPALSVLATTAAPLIAAALDGLSMSHRIEFSYRPDALVVAGFTHEDLNAVYPRLVNVFRAGGWSHRNRYDHEWVRLVEVALVPPWLQSRTDLPVIPSA